MIKSKLKELECSQDFSHYKSMGIFPDAQGQLTLQSLVDLAEFRIVLDVIYVLVVCKYKDDPITKKSASPRVFTIFPHYIPMGAIGCHGNQSSDPIWPKA